MYNEELKKRFISEQSVRSPWKVKVCEAVFNFFEEYEEAWGADLCTRSKEELQPVVDQMMGFRARSKNLKLILLKEYSRWCTGMNVEGSCDGILQITTIGLDKVKQHTVANPKHLQQYLDVLFESPDKKATDNIYRCFYWLAYAGMEEEDILDVKIKDVDFRNMVINYPRRNTVVPIYPEALPVIRNCVELDSFLFIHPNYSNDVWRDRIPGDVLIRGVKALSGVSTFKSELSRRSRLFSDRTPLKLSYFRVWMSGVFYRMYEQEIIGIPPNFDAIVAQQMEGKTYKLDSGRNTMRAKHRQLVRDYEEDYDRWKLAWYL